MSDASLRPNPAEEAAQQALEKVHKFILGRNSFRLEAGAGAGKTYSLIKALKFILENQGAELQRRCKKVACITYTNVATDQITAQTDGHPVVHSSTIHAFCWALIKSFQPVLREELPNIVEWSEKLNEIGGIGLRKIDYDLGHRRAKPDEQEVYLGHDDVLTLMVALMGYKKFRNLLTTRFPILFIDEYQDTNRDFAQSMLTHFIDKGEGPLIGLFGDSWQKIYGDGCGLIENTRLEVIGKKANFRSVKNIVDVLNKMRPDLPQEVTDPDATGSVIVYHTNNWPGERKPSGRGGHWEGDLFDDDAHRCLELVRSLLEKQGWDFSPKKTKILMLTHKVLATEQDYRKIAEIFRYNDSYIKKENSYIAFLVDTVEPACLAYKEGRYGEMFSVLGSNLLKVKSRDDKIGWSEDMGKLLDIREQGTIGDVVDHIGNVKHLMLSDAVQRMEKELADASPAEIEASRGLKEINELRGVAYKELIALSNFLNDHTPFSTKHGVKGAEFENVLIVLGRGWNRYNWNTFLEMSQNGVSEDKIEFYESNRNLFYVACSRPKKRLALLFTQELSDAALETLISWFGENTIIALSE